MLTEVPLDITDLGSVREAARIVSTYNDSIDVLVNNAAVLSRLDGVLEEVDFGQVMQTIDVNACGPLRVVQQFLPLLQAGQGKSGLSISRPKPPASKTANEPPGTATACRRPL